MATPTHPPTLPLRERKKLKTRHTIQDAALDLFVTASFDAITVEQIAERAEVAPATVYRYFATKEDIVVWDDHGTDVAAFLEARDPTEPLLVTIGAVLTDLLPTSAASDARLLERTQLVFGTPAILARSRERRDEVVRAFAAYLAKLRGRREDDLDVEIATRCMFEAFSVAADRWQRAGGRRSLAHYSAEAFAAMEHWDRPAHTGRKERR